MMLITAESTFWPPARMKRSLVKNLQFFVLGSLRMITFGMVYRMKYDCVCDGFELF